ncbi:glycoside hydrolase family 29 protein [Xylariaceae sp. FL0016]|nr:glycoside hydrolase family 29 protein [Xylariaceae sp. FL0016]
MGFSKAMRFVLPLAGIITSLQIDLESYFNNKGFGTYPGEASFDALGQSYPAPELETSFYKSATSGIEYSFPGYTGRDTPDNVICAGQEIPIPSYANASSCAPFSASFLISGDVEFATVLGNVTFTYSDNSTSTYELRTLDWYSWLTLNRGELVLPYRFTNEGINWNTSHVFERTAALSPGKNLTSITLPTTTNATEGRLHVFAISLWAGPAVSVQSVRPTQKWLDIDEQVVEVTLNNAGPECIAGNGVNVSLTGDGFNTSRIGSLKRLCPGDQKIVTVGVKGSSSGPIDVNVLTNDGPTQYSSRFSDIEIGLTTWTTELDSLARHETPDWFNDAKYGIFIHWGPYAVTGWGNSSPYESYAEWFWWYSTHHPQADSSDFYDYRLRTYGEAWAYDDTFPDFTAANYDPKAWVDLIADAGAGSYFVLTSKHHDGFSIFDAGNTTNRTSLHYGPQHDLLGELFDAAKMHQPHLKRGTYFSLPEWYNPDFGPYGFDQLNSTEDPGTSSWPGVPAKNPYTGMEEPYTGHIPVDDFLTDLMKPQMDILAYDCTLFFFFPLRHHPRIHGTDIMWCDIGGPNITAPFAASWWNEAREQNRQVTANSRCGVAQAADFDTPEYATFSSPQARKWETNRGMDPYSYGYNSATPVGEYMNASEVISTLVDIVSKNGNLLLDIGPRADGSLVQAEVDALRESGAWLASHGEAIFNTTYWFVQSQVVVDGIDVRFTQTNEAFYALFLARPTIQEGLLTIPAPVPALVGDTVSLLAVDGADDLAWSIQGEGADVIFSVEVDEEMFDQEEHCWVLKITYA